MKRFVVVGLGGEKGKEERRQKLGGRRDRKGWREDRKEGREEGREEGRKEGRKERKEEKGMYYLGLDGLLDRDGSEDSALWRKGRWVSRRKSTEMRTSSKLSISLSPLVIIIELSIYIFSTKLHAVSLRRWFRKRLHILLLGDGHGEAWSLLLLLPPHQAPRW